VNEQGEQTEQLSGSQQQEQQSTWSGIWRKVVMLWPFMWPKGSVPLQLSVIACVFLLIAGRVANLFLPLYYKKIGELMLWHQLADLWELRLFTAYICPCKLQQ